MGKKKSKKWSVRYEATVKNGDRMINTVPLAFDKAVTVDHCINIVYRALKQMEYNNIYIGWYKSYD